MQSVMNEFRRWFPSQEGGCGEGGGVMVRRGSKGKGDEEGRSKVKDAVRRLDNIKIGTSPQGMKGAVRIPGLSADTNTDDDPEVQLKRPNNLPSLSDSGPYGRKENVMVLPSLSPESDKQQNKLGQENHGILKLSESWGKGEAQKGKECSVTKPAVLPRPPLVNNAANGAHCPAGPSPHSVTLSERDVDPVIDTQAPGSTSLGDKHRQPASESSRLKLNPREDRQHRSLSFPQRLLTASPSTTTATSTATATTAATKGKSLPAKLNPKDFNEKTISRWKKEHLVSTLARALMKRPDDVPASSTLCPPSPKYFSACTTPVPASPTSASPPDVPDFPSSAAAFPTSSSTNSSILPDSRSSFADSFISITDSPSSCPNTTSLVADTSSPLIDAPTPVSDPSPDVPDTSKWKITNKLSLRRVSNTILNTVAQLFAQFLPKPSPSKTLLLSSTSSGEKVQEVAQEEAGDIVMRRKPSRSRDVKIEEEEDDDFVDVDMKRRLSSKETHRKVYVYEEDATHVFAPRDTLTQGANRVRDIVRMIEDGMKNNADTAKQADTVIRKLGSEVLHNMRLPLNNPMEWNDDGKQSPENKPIKEEISKGDGGGGGGVGGVNQQDANSLITQSPTSGMKENEDQTGIEESDKEAEWKLFAALQGTSFRSKRRNSEIKIGGEGKRKSEKEKEDEENEKGRGDKQRSQEKNENGDRQEDSEKISEEGQRDNEENEKQEIKIVVDEEETESDTDEENVIMRSRPRERPMPFYRYSTLGPRVRLPQNTIYPFCVVRPRTVIISLGVCTEAKYINDSFGDGVSESESEDEEDISPAPVSAPAPTPTRQRPATPSRTSRPHSPLSDMDTESKRNSQAVSTEPSDLEDHSSVTTSDIECPEPPVVDSRKDKAYRIALELLHTERTYVKVLHLIDQEFQFRVDNENRAHHMFPPDVILHMFSNIKSIYKLHHDFLLPQLEERMAQWEHNRRIGDIMKNFAPFLKMYTEYVRNFDNAMTLINQWQAKCPRFAAIMDDIHSMEVCGNLTLQHHMLSPVQRIPRYEMLLRDYLKKLPEDSPDCHDTEKALHLVSTAANHANDAMKKIDKFEKLLEIQESLGGAEDLVSPTRELIKEGKIIKISARSGDHQERYIFLLTDLLLLCSPKLMSGRVMSGPQYRLRAKYHVENLIIQEGDNLETANTFYIKDNNKSVELYTQTIEEKEQWLDAFIRAIHETSQRKSSLKLHFNPNQRVIDVDLGQKQPMLIRSDSVTKCMECGSQFTMVRRKHHCRACGAVVCSKCSSFKASLAYECGKSVRVCRTCHATLQELSSSTATPSPEIDDGDECSVYSAKDQLDLPFRNRGVLEVSAKTSGAVMQGFLQLKTHRKTWVKRWFALHTDFVLYSFKCEADDQALTATPVPGFTVTHLQGTRNESGISDKEKERAFKLHHAKKQYIFQAASKDESQRWVAALKKASQAELPSPVQ